MTQVEWLGDVRFTVAAARQGYDIVLGKMLQTQPASSADVEVPYLRSASVQWSGVQVDDDRTMWAKPREVFDYGVRDGDLLVCEGGDVGRGALYQGLPGRIIQNSLHRVRARGDNDVRFFGYVLAALHGSAYLDVLCNKATIRHLTGDKLKGIEIPLPSPEEQRRIADFLDVEVEGISRTTQARNAQIRLLQEREFALIAAALGGEDVREERLPTGWTWLPGIPAGWSVGPVYAYFDVLLGKMLNAERATGPYPRQYLRNANVHWYEIDADDLAEMSFESDELLRYSVRKGDLLVCEGGAGVAEAAVWDGRVEECYYQKSLHRVRARQSVPVEWLMYWLRLAKEVGIFASEGNVATIPHLTGEQLREYRIPIPLDGQARVGRLTREVQELHGLISTLRSANSLLEERRHALITAAVAGQIDVTTARGAAI